MRDNVHITREEARRIASDIYEANFEVCGYRHGYGHFNISCEEFANILMIAVNNCDAKQCLNKHYGGLEG